MIDVIQRVGFSTAVTHIMAGRRTANTAGGGHVRVRSGETVAHQVRYGEKQNDEGCLEHTSLSKHRLRLPSDMQNDEHGARGLQPKRQ
jgi:hypothetical protein